MLDGNAVAGLLQEMFAADMTTAGWDLCLGPRALTGLSDPQLRPLVVGRVSAAAL